MEKRPTAIHQLSLVPGDASRFLAAIHEKHDHTITRTVRIIANQPTTLSSGADSKDSKDKDKDGKGASFAFDASSGSRLPLAEHVVGILNSRVLVLRMREPCLASHPPDLDAWLEQFQRAPTRVPEEEQFREAIGLPPVRTILSLARFLHF